MAIALICLQPPLSVHSKSKSLSCVSRPQLRTSLDLELDLQASQTRLHQQQEEICRLKTLKKKFEEAKEKGAYRTFS